MSAPNMKSNDEEDDCIHHTLEIFTESKLHIATIKTHIVSSTIANDPISVLKMQRLILMVYHAIQCHGHHEAKSRLKCQQVCRQCDDNDEQSFQPLLETEPCEFKEQCREMKKMLFEHILDCRANFCQMSSSASTICNSNPMCNYVRYAIWHYRHCADWHTCPVCHPLRSNMLMEERGRKGLRSIDEDVTSENWES